MILRISARRRFFPSSRTWLQVLCRRLERARRITSIAQEGRQKQAPVYVSRHRKSSIISSHSITASLKASRDIWISWILHFMFLPFLKLCVVLLGRVVISVAQCDRVKIEISLFTQPRPSTNSLSCPYFQMNNTNLTLSSIQANEKKRRNVCWYS